jgi:hypothetical protein
LRCTAPRRPHKEINPNVLLNFNNAAVGRRSWPAAGSTFFDLPPGCSRAFDASAGGRRCSAMTECELAA